MRIVSIGLTVFFLLIGAIPLLSGRLTPRDIGFLMGAISTLVVIAFILGRAVGWLSRKENAAHIGYSVGILLGIIVFVSSFAGARERAVERAKRNSGGWEPVSYVERYLDGHPYANAPDDTDEGRGYAAAKQMLEDMRASMTELAIATNKSIKVRFDVIAQSSSLKELNQYKYIAERHDLAAKDCARYFADLEGELDDRLKARGVDADTRGKILTDFAKGIPADRSKNVELIKQNELLASHVNTLLDILVAEWGSWKVDPAQKKILFEDQATLDSFQTMIKLIDECRQKIAALLPPELKEK